MEIGAAFLQRDLEDARGIFNTTDRQGREPLPHLAALVCCAPFDLALHDAYGRALQRPTYSTYTAEFMNRDLADYFRADKGSAQAFRGLYPADFLVRQPPARLPVWHLMGGQDALDKSDAAGTLNDGYPVALIDWIRRDGLRCLKIKLRGTDASWDYDRCVRIGRIAAGNGVDWLSADFNCTVVDPIYVTDILDRLLRDEPRIYGMLLYVEQPFPYDLEANRIDVHCVSARKPLFLDESAHDWPLVRLGRHLGWTGVALKTCKTQTGALLSLCWARPHGMTLMVQDLTNTAPAVIAHVQLAAVSTGKGAGICERG